MLNVDTLMVCNTFQTKNIDNNLLLLILSSFNNHVEFVMHRMRTIRFFSRFPERSNYVWNISLSIHFQSRFCQARSRLRTSHIEHYKICNYTNGKRIRYLRSATSVNWNGSCFCAKWLTVERCLSKSLRAKMAIVNIDCCKKKNRTTNKLLFFFLSRKIVSNWIMIANIARFDHKRRKRGHVCARV